MPRALNRIGALNELITDLWCRPGSGLSFLNDSLSERFHPELVNATVRSANASLLAFELASRAKSLEGWKLTRERNSWFQNHTLSQLTRQSNGKDSHTTVFAYSYAAAEALRFARERSWETVLGQIDPGPAEERLVARLHEEAGLSHTWESAPRQYWDDWHLECELADRIVVNSEWSRQSLMDEGIPSRKIIVTPLAFEPSPQAICFQRNYPEEFTDQRPLRVLFLGQITLRKGVHTLLEAVRLLSGAPIDFWFVGPIQMELPEEFEDHPRVKWLGPVSRHETNRYYREADVFIFPTFSDGFGLTQLEAQSWKLPIVASARCGEVVQNGINGLVLGDISAEAIANALIELVNYPDRLQEMSDHCTLREQFQLDSLAESLVNG